MLDELQKIRQRLVELRAQGGHYLVTGALDTSIKALAEAVGRLEIEAIVRKAERDSSRLRRTTG